jgi:hypothetical protein
MVGGEPMKLYYASAGGAAGMEHRDKLESFWYKRDALEAMRQPGDFFLDSGAFTAFTKDVIINPEDYARFIHANEKNITIASSLDAIGDAAETYRLYRLMKDELGCPDVIPVFHCREDFKWLERYIEEKVPYMALGGMVPEAKPWLKKWLDLVWGDYLTNEDGSAKIKVHGFGMTILDFMQDYPWFSVDSSSWTYGGRFSYGLILYPNGRYAWTYFGQNHSSRKEWGGKNFWTYDSELQKHVEKFITTLGFDVAAFEDTHQLNLFNAAVFDSWSHKSLGIFKRDKIQQGLF